MAVNPVACIHSKGGPSMPSPTSSKAIGGKFFAGTEALYKGKQTTTTLMEGAGPCAIFSLTNGNEKISAHLDPRYNLFPAVLNKLGESFYDLTKRGKEFFAILIGGDANSDESMRFGEEILKLLEDNGYNITALYGSKSFDPKNASTRMNLFSKTNSHIYGGPLDNIDPGKNFLEELKNQFEEVNLSDAFNYKLITPDKSFDIGNNFDIIT